MKTVIITLLLTAASVMSCKPPMPPTDNESACTSSCKQDQRTADVIGEADIITGIASDDFPSLFIQGEMKEVPGSDGEYHYWKSDEWYYIDKKGNRSEENRQQ